MNGDIALPYHGIGEEFLSKTMIRILTLLGRSSDTVALILCTDEEIRAVNEQYRNRDYPTDVITFAYNEVPFPGEELDSNHAGDIFLSMDRALEQSREYDIPLENELIRLLVHSVLHLYGYDHETGAENAKRMYAKEDEVISRLTGTG